MNETNLVPIEEFNKKLDELRKTNSLVDRLINDLGTWEKFPEHLRSQLFEMVGCRPIINKY